MNQYLVVWSGPSDPVDSEVREIHARMVAADGTLLGPDEITISEMDHASFFLDPFAPRASFNPTSNQFVVTWMGTKDGATPGTADSEVWCQILDENGAEIGQTDLRLSDMGPDGDPTFAAGFPAVASATNRSSLVCFIGYDQVSIPAGGTAEVYAQVLAHPFTAIESPRLGTPANPNAFLPGVTSGPILGATWDPVVDHSTFAPASLVDVAVVSSGSAQIPFGPSASILVDLTAATYTFVATPGAPFAIPIPSLASLVGVPAYSQAGSLDGSTIALANALDVFFGTE